MRTAPTGITAVSVSVRVVESPNESVTVSVTVTMPGCCTTHGAVRFAQSTTVSLSLHVSASPSGSDTAQLNVVVNGAPPRVGDAEKSSITGGWFGRFVAVIASV